MRILHVVSSIDKTTGGPAESITSLVCGLIEHSKSSIKLITRESNNPVTGKFQRAEEVVVFLKSDYLGCFSNFNLAIQNRTPVIIHGHGMWDLPIHQMVFKARKAGIPYILSVHGMLAPWALGHKNWKKKIAMALYQRRDLDHAICLHATSEMEASNIRKLGLRNSIAVIPNGIEIPELNCDTVGHNVQKKKVLFLSRIHKVKGIENLIAAWKNIPNSIRFDWTLEIIGNGESEYINKLKNIIIENSLVESVKILDPVFDDRKKEIYQSADIFVLPTFSENFGMVVAEAMSYGIPVITTKGAPWEELETRNAGWWIDIGVEPLTHALINAISTPKLKLVEMGLNGRKLVEDKYSIETVAKQMSELYYWILKQGPKPDFIFD
jgi:glycosyltransferase involved in cell wall biosynthesis